MDPVRHRGVTPHARPDTHQRGPDPAREDAPERNAVVAGLTLTALIGGKAKGVVIDRTRAAFAYSHAKSQGKTGKWAVELASGRLTNDVVPITGGTVRAFGRTVTTNGWKQSYQASNAIGLGLLGVSLLYGFPNLVEGWHDGGGPEGLIETRSGRTGVFATVGNVVGLSAMGVALSRSPSNAKLAGMLSDPIHSSMPLVLLRLGVSIPVLANELGYLDFLDARSEATPWESARATTAKVVDKVTPG